MVDFSAPPAPRGRAPGAVRTVTALILREMATGYGRSPGGYLWAVLEPVAAIALLTAIFSLGFSAPALGRNFAIFYATGLLPFLMFTDLAGKVAASLTYSKALLSYPAVTFLDAMLARFLLNLVTQLTVGAVVLGGILLAFETGTAPDLPRILGAAALVAALGFGFGAINCLLFTLVPLWQRVWSVATRPLFVLSGTLYVFEAVPQPWRDWLWYNPLIHAVGAMRAGFYPYYDAGYVSILYPLGLSLGLSVTALLFLRRHHHALLAR